MNKKLTRIEDTLQAELHVYNEQNIQQTEMLKDIQKTLSWFPTNNAYLPPSSIFYGSAVAAFISFILGYTIGAGL